MIVRLRFVALLLTLSVLTELGSGCGALRITSRPSPEKVLPLRAGRVKINRIAVCRSIEEREPVDIASEFPSDIGKVWCFTEAIEVGPETAITHVWYHRDIKRASVKLKVQGLRWRTYSSKNIWPTWTGPWRVEILDEDGAVLERISFTIKP